MDVAGGNGVRTIARFILAETIGESIAFWFLAILTFLVFSTLATSPGTGYAERLTEANVIAFEFNGFLWMPIGFGAGYPPANPIPYLAWWAGLGLVLAKIATLVGRVVLRTGTRRRRPRAAGANGKR